MGLAQALSLRLERRLILLRATAARRALAPQGGRAARSRLARLPRGAICAVCVIRDEAERLPRFFDWHRGLGVDLFLIIDNGSVDGGDHWVAAQPDAVLWRARGSYRAARFGMDWVNAVLGRWARGRWVLTLDADELLVYPMCDARPLQALTHWLERCGRRSLPAQMVDLYPGPEVPPDPAPDARLGGPRLHGDGAAGGASPGRGADAPGGDAWRRAGLDRAWFDPCNTLVERDPRYANLWIRGGPRLRLAAERPHEAPALNKTPLIRWARGDAYVSGAHAALPRGLNRGFARDGAEGVSAAILHTKLLDGDPARAADPARMAEHYAGGREHAAWAAAAARGAGFHGPFSAPLQGWRSLARAGLMGRGLWA
ncbi:glycosyltransferase family 2 protein [Rhodovulum sp. DZ06]|uniref:glycosyltransferase family 2 protein n=1 Tax=Rhodovulum sp. DZ06 TaxID=3425126 RepID=UPI003D33FB79